MGKKSKRRTGKQSQKIQGENASTRDTLAVPDTEEVAPKRYNVIAEEDEEEFIEFMLWSLGKNKADLTPKSFAKSAPRMAMKLIASDVSIQGLLERRKETIETIEKGIQCIEARELFKGIKIDHDEMIGEFEQQLYENLSNYVKEFKNTPISYDSFQENISKLANKGGICLDDSFYFKLSRVEFDELFRRMVEKQVSQSSQYGGTFEKIIQNYYMHPTAREESHKEADVYAQKTLVSLLKLYKEMHKCWRCNQLYGKGNETKSLNCASCKCAVYCSRECQKKHWKEGTRPHKECCQAIGSAWSAHERRKKRIGRAFKEGRIINKPVIVNDIKRECFLRPCEPLDYNICANRIFITEKYIANAAVASMNTYYQNIATLACGGKHLLFGDDTISSCLEEKIRNGYEDVISEFDPESMMENEVMELHLVAGMLQYKESDLTKECTIRSYVSVDRFITLYICYVHFDLGKETFGGTMNKFIIEMKFLEELKKST
ncbi:hypothetical protein CTEN210_14840 [Chaetoceros tenuissimus]|uniref:MYND-type domain-containing protein n=1 Tax=Chaetoceros tenuissimus TaxID=426638 RepID=A0AAD3D982_9STRA|nr:hypothetical protein CTEN210_14840 [Chaetoceros tenuissimus]